MKIQNTTNFPNEKIREIIRFVKPNGVSKFHINIKNSQYVLRGRAYTEGCNYHKEDTNVELIVVAIGSENNFPFHCPGKGAYLELNLSSREESLVYLIAHELRHLWQKKHPKGWRAKGSRGQYSERDADVYALGKLEEYKNNKEKKGIIDVA